MSFQNRIHVPPAGGCLFPVLDRGNGAAVEIDREHKAELFALTQCVVKRLAAQSVNNGDDLLPSSASFRAAYRELPVPVK